MYKYLLVILEEGSVPFCHYSNPRFDSLAGSAFMPLGTLESVVRHARARDLYINVLYGKTRPPREYEELIASVNHVKMITLCLQDVYEDGVLVLDADDCGSLAQLGAGPGRNMILRAGKEHLARLAGLVESLRGKYKRLNLHLVGLETFTARDYAVYESEIGKLGKMLHRCYKAGEEVELNVLSDRMLLDRMNNCEAGIKHLTVAPDGKCYICPGFYHDGEGGSVGDFAEGQDITFKNRQLLAVGHAPLCSRCDAYHCKRCVYLNKKLTLEINTPSEQQCVIAHIEREASRRLLGNLQHAKPFDRTPPIPGLTYRDPLTAVVRAKWRREDADADEYGDADSGDHLARIYELQKKIARKLGAD